MINIVVIIMKSYKLGDTFNKKVKICKCGSLSKSKGYTDKNFDPAAIKKGLKIEMEHTCNVALARQIVLDHLTESKNYYDLLEHMEKKLIKPKYKK